MHQIVIWSTHDEEYLGPKGAAAREKRLTLFSRGRILASGFKVNATPRAATSDNAQLRER